MATKRDTRTVLLKTALPLLWTQSYGSVSVDDICKKAKAKKGSFYHYFESKSELAKAAMEYLWEEMRPELDQIFSPQRPPLERIRLYADVMLQEQEKLQQEYGHVVGCPFSTVGSEQCCRGDGVSKKSKEILSNFTTYLKSAIQDAISEGSLPQTNAAAAAGQLLTYELGALSLARVANNLDPMRGLYDVWLCMLGARTCASGERQVAA